MRFRLRTLLIVLALAPPVLAVVIWVTAFLFTPWEESPVHTGNSGRSGTTISVNGVELFFPSN